MPISSSIGGLQDHRPKEKFRDKGNKVMGSCSFHEALQILQYSILLDEKTYCLLLIEFPETVLEGCLPDPNIFSSHKLTLAFRDLSNNVHLTGDLHISSRRSFQERMNALITYLLLILRFHGVYSNLDEYIIGSDFYSLSEHTQSSNPASRSVYDYHVSEHSSPSSVVCHDLSEHRIAYRLPPIGSVCHFSTCLIDGCFDLLVGLCGASGGFVANLRHLAMKCDHLMSILNSKYKTIGYIEGFLGVVDSVGCGRALVEEHVLEI